MQIWCTQAKWPQEKKKKQNLSFERNAAWSTNKKTSNIKCEDWHMAQKLWHLNVIKTLNLLYHNNVSFLVPHIFIVIFKINLVQYSHPKLTILHMNRLQVFRGLSWSRKFALGLWPPPIGWRNKCLTTFNFGGQHGGSLLYLLVLGIDSRLGCKSWHCRPTQGNQHLGLKSVFNHWLLNGVSKS